MKKLGRNQLIAIVAGSIVLGASYALVWTGQVTGAEWLGFAQWLLPSWLAIVLGASAAVKATTKPTTQIETAAGSTLTSADGNQT